MYIAFVLLQGRGAVRGADLPELYEAVDACMGPSSNTDHDTRDIGNMRHPFDSVVVEDSILRSAVEVHK